VSGLVWLKCDEGTTFNNYGNDYRLKDISEARKIKTITATIAETRTFTKSIKIVWTIPIEASMLQDPNDNEFYTRYGKSNTLYNFAAGRGVITTEYTLEEWQKGVAL
jgi:hypothetical protein